MQIKKQKINKIKIKNSFIDLNIIFKFDYWYIHTISEEQIENTNRFIRFYDKSLLQKEEILLNDYLKKELRKIVALKKEKERLKIDTDLIPGYITKYDEKENTLEKIDIGAFNFPTVVPLKRLTKKNNDSNENKFSIKILQINRGHIIIGLTTLNCTFKKLNCIGWKNSWGFNCYNGMKRRDNEKCDLFTNFHGKVGDIIGIKYDSLKGEIELFINNQSKGVMFSGLDINQNYRFGVTLLDAEDKIKIIE